MRLSLWPDTDRALCFRNEGWGLQTLASFHKEHTDSFSSAARLWVPSKTSPTRAPHIVSQVPIETSSQTRACGLLIFCDWPRLKSGVVSSHAVPHTKGRRPGLNHSSALSLGLLRREAWSWGKSQEVSLCLSEHHWESQPWYLWVAEVSR